MRGTLCNMFTFISETSILHVYIYMRGTAITTKVMRKENDSHCEFIRSQIGQMWNNIYRRWASGISLVCRKKKRNLVSLTFEHSRSTKSSTISKNNSIRPLESRALSIVAYLKRIKNEKKRGIKL